MALDKLLFIKVKPIESLKPDQFPLWGKMTPQHMVEHLTDSFKMSVNKIKVEVISPEKKLAVLKKILMSSRPLPKNYQNPILSIDPPDLQNKNIFFAKQLLHEEISAFYSFFKSNPDTKTINPIFGRLNEHEWEVFHVKHFEHHMNQFGLR